MNNSGEILRSLRKAKGMTQKQVADRLGVVPKTVSKWETGHGLPDISVISDLADILDTSERTLLSGELGENTADSGNMRKIKFYVCPNCGGFVQSTGEGSVVCCGKRLEPLLAKNSDETHRAEVSEDGNEVYVSFNHEMAKEHHISFVSYVSFDRVLTVKLYPEQAAEVRFAKTHGGKLFYYCNKHGLFNAEQKRNI